MSNGVYLYIYISLIFSNHPQIKLMIPSAPVKVKLAPVALCAHTFFGHMELKSFVIDPPGVLLLERLLALPCT